MNEINGVICINKPQDFTSFDVVAIMRRAAGTRKIGPYISPFYSLIKAHFPENDKKSGIFHRLSKKLTVRNFCPLTRLGILPIMTAENKELWQKGMV